MTSYEQQKKKRIIFQPPHVKVANNESSAKNDMNTYPVLSSTHQGGPKYEKSQNTNRQHTKNMEKLTISWDGLTFQEKPG